MNPVFVFLVILGAALLWLLLAFIYRFVGGLATKLVDNAKVEMSDEETNREAFVRGFKEQLWKETKYEND